MNYCERGLHLTDCTRYRLALIMGKVSRVHSVSQEISEDLDIHIPFLLYTNMYQYTKQSKCVLASTFFLRRLCSPSRCFGYNGSQL